MRSTLGRVPAGSLHGTVVTENEAFDALAPSIPNTNDEIIVSGAIEGVPVSKAKRTGVNTIAIYYCFDATTVGVNTITNGVETSFALSISW